MCQLMLSSFFTAPTTYSHLPLSRGCGLARLCSMEVYQKDKHRGSQHWDATMTNGFNNNNTNSTNKTDSTAQLTSIHELHPYCLPLPSPERCGLAHFAQQREIRERSEGRMNGGTSGLKWYVVNSFRPFGPFLPTDYPYPARLSTCSKIQLHIGRLCRQLDIRWLQWR